MNDNLFRLLAILIFVSVAGISIYHRQKADRQGGKVSLKEEGTAMLISLRITGLATWGSIIAWLINPAWMNWSRIDLPEWLRGLGIAMGVLGIFLAWWVFTSLKNNVTPTVVTRAQAKLVTEGPYRWVRHPLYLMGTIGIIGFALVAENWFIAFVSLIGFVILLERTKIEEAMLIKKFGDDYRRYMENTGSFFPKFR